MTELGELKPLLNALALPPAGPLLLALLGLLWMRRHKATGAFVAGGALVLAWFVSCNAVAVWLAGNLLPQVPALSVATLKASPVQAIVVLGGGVLPLAPEYGQAQPAQHTLTRLRYGIWLARQTGLPLGFAGGVGWGATGTQAPPEGQVARRVAQDEFGVALRWVDDQSRDTAEGARMLGNVLRRDGVTHVALVTDAWHMPRSVQAFERAGLKVLPAPTGYGLPSSRALLEWLPSPWGLSLSRQVLREWLGLQVARLAR